MSGDFPYRGEFPQVMAELDRNPEAAPLKLVELPVADIGTVAKRLRDLADAIEEGHFGEAHNVAWVIDCGQGHCEVGYIGRAPGVAGSDAHFLLAIGQRKLEAVGLE